MLTKLPPATSACAVTARLRQLGSKLADAFTVIDSLEAGGVMDPATVSTLRSAMRAAASAQLTASASAPAIRTYVKSPKAEG